MHPALVEVTIANVRTRVGLGDQPGPFAYTTEWMEDALLALAAERDALRAQIENRVNNPVTEVCVFHDELSSVLGQPLDLTQVIHCVDPAAIFQSGTVIYDPAKPTMHVGNGVRVPVSMGFKSKSEDIEAYEHGSPASCKQRFPDAVGFRGVNQ